MGAVILIGVFALMMGSLWLSGVLSMNAKKDMWCVVCYTQDTHFKLRTAFEEAGLYYTDAGLSPSATAYDGLGSAQRTPKEIWIRKQDMARARGIIEFKVKSNVEETEFAWLLNEA